MIIFQNHALTFDKLSRVILSLALGVPSLMASSAFGDEDELLRLRREASSNPLSVSLSTSLYETPIDPDSAFHVRILGASVDLGYKLPETNLKFFENPSLGVRLGYSDQIDVEDNSSNLENSSVSLTGLGYSFSEQLRLRVPLAAVAATNEDDRVFRSYIGSFVASPSLYYSFTQGALARLRVGITSRYNRSFYDFDTTLGDVYNPESSFGLGLSANYVIESFYLFASFSNSTTTLADGSQLDDRYSASVGVTYNQSNNLSYGFSWQQTDRTFGYGGTGSNVNFGYADLSLLGFSATYRI